MRTTLNPVSLTFLICRQSGINTLYQNKNGFVGIERNFLDFSAPPVFSIYFRHKSLATQRISPCPRGINLSLSGNRWRKPGNFLLIPCRFEPATRHIRRVKSKFAMKINSILFLSICRNTPERLPQSFPNRKDTALMPVAMPTVNQLLVTFNFTDFDRACCIHKLYFSDAVGCSTVSPHIVL